MKEVIISVCCILFGFGVMLIARHSEKKEWNKGICSKCNKKWSLFDTDSQGGRGYECPECGKTIWISYKVDK